MKTIRPSAIKVAGLLTLAMTALPFAFAPAASAAVLSASINSVSFKAAVATTYDHTTGGGAWNDGSTTYQKGELQASDYQCGDYASFFLELTTPASPAAGSPFRTKIVNSFTLDTTGQSGVSLYPQVGADHLFVQDGTNDTAPNPASPTASIDRTTTPPAVVVTGTEFQSGASAALTYYVDNVQANQKVIIRVDALIKCKPGGSSPTGNLQANLVSVEVTNPAETISAGNQTVNFKTMGNLGMVVLVKKVSTNGTCTAPAPVDTVSVAVNAAVRYCYTVTNYSNAPSLNVSLIDDNATPGNNADDVTVVLSGLSDQDSDTNADDLAANSVADGFIDLPGGFGTDGQYTNIASLKVAGVTRSVADAVVNVGAVPNFSITKTSTSVVEKAGDVITYTITMTNTGSAPLTGVTIADPKATLTTCTNSAGGGAVSQSGHTSTVTALATTSDTWTCTATYTVQAADVTAKSVDNTATGDTTETAAKTASRTVNLSLFTITKTSTSVPSQAGDVITYTITMTNTGNTGLTGATIADPKATLTSCTNSAGGGAVSQSGHTSTSTTLAASETWTCTATYTVLAADVTAKSVDNTATGDTDQNSPKTASKTVDLALFTITKNSSSTPTQAGNVITYTITMTNTGNIGLTGATIADPLANLTTCTNSAGGGAVSQSGHTSTVTALAATNDTWTCTATHTVTQAEVNAGVVNNTATGDTTETPSKTADKSVTITRTPSFTVVKSDTTATAPKKAGDVVSFSITVTNTGNTTLNSMTITDANAVVGTCNVANGSNLAPAATLTCAATHAVTQAEVDAGKTENTAIASATGQTSVSSNKVTIPIVPNPTLGVTLDQITDKKLVIGDKVDYEVVVTNTGNITLKNVVPSVNNFVITSCTPVVPTTLAPGETIKCKGYHVVTAADVVAGIIRAKAIATGVSALDSSVKVPAAAPDVEVPIDLPVTGSHTTLPATWGTLMLLLGAGMLILRRRRLA